MLARAPRIYDATSDDLSAFKARDGTLIWHRWADGANHGDVFHWLWVGNAP